MTPYDVLMSRASELAEWCVGQVVGCIEVVAADYDTTVNVFHEEAVLIRLTLSNPPPDDLTWPLGDLHAVYRLVDEKAAEILGDDPWVVRVLSVRDQEWLARAADG